MESIWLVTAQNGGHEAGWPVRAFATRAEAEAWAAAEEARVKAAVVAGDRRPYAWVDGESLSVEEVPFAGAEDSRRGPSVAGVNSAV